jgi:hypothetical protein
MNAVDAVNLLALVVASGWIATVARDLVRPL